MSALFSLHIKPLAPCMLDACAAIAATAPDPWTRNQLEAALHGTHTHCYVAMHGSHPVAFACFLLVDASADLQLVVVGPAFRKQGIAHRLLTYSLPKLKALGADKCLLEARVSNLPALALYKRLGFKELARRPGMYKNPPEDGFLYAKTL